MLHALFIYALVLIIQPAASFIDVTFHCVQSVSGQSEREDGKRETALYSESGTRKNVTERFMKFL